MRNESLSCRPRQTSCAKGWRRVQDRAPTRFVKGRSRDRGIGGNRFLVGIISSSNCEANQALNTKLCLARALYRAIPTPLHVADGDQEFAQYVSRHHTFHEDGRLHNQVWGVSGKASGYRKARHAGLYRDMSRRHFRGLGFRLALKKNRRPKGRRSSFIAELHGRSVRLLCATELADVRHGPPFSIARDFNQPVNCPSRIGGEVRSRSSRAMPPRCQPHSRMRLPQGSSIRSVKPRTHALS